jgi:hypothetical protein
VCLRNLIVAGEKPCPFLSVVKKRACMKGVTAMKKKWIVVLVLSLAVASFSWAGNNATLPKQKLYRHTPDDGSRKTFIVKFRSDKAMESFISGKRLPAEPTHRFHRFDMVAV